MRGSWQPRTNRNCRWKPRAKGGPSTRRRCNFKVPPWIFSRGGNPAKCNRAVQIALGNFSFLLIHSNQSICQRAFILLKENFSSMEVVAKMQDKSGYLKILREAIEQRHHCVAVHCESVF